MTLPGTSPPGSAVSLSFLMTSQQGMDILTRRDILTTCCLTTCADTNPRRSLPNLSRVGWIQQPLLMYNSKVTQGPTMRSQTGTDTPNFPISRSSSCSSSCSSYSPPSSPPSSPPLGFARSETVETAETILRSVQTEGEEDSVTGLGLIPFVFVHFQYWRM